MSQSKLSPSGPVVSSIATVANPALPGGPIPVLTAPGTLNPTHQAVIVVFPSGAPPAGSVSVSQAIVNNDGSVSFTLDNGGAAIPPGFPIFILGFSP